jgi:hypothetical protein
MWHEWIHNTLRRLGVPYMAEVNMTPWLPEGWGGTLDALVWHPDLKAFVLTDFKTQKGEGIRWIRRDGAKDDHKLQTSAYWHAARKMGVPLAKVIGVYYLPKNDTRSKEDVVEPILADFTPLPARELHAEMKRRNKRVRSYVASLPKPNPRPLFPEEFVTDELEPVQEREQRVYFDRETETWDLKLVPHWSTAYCPFHEDVCDCSTQRTTKIGMFDVDGTYYPRKGFEHIEPTVFPRA